MEIEGVNFFQKQRLAYIDFKLLFVGHITRAEIVQYFEKGLTSATRDINLYKELKPENMIYDAKEKKYFQQPSFKPLFEHDPKIALIKLSHQIRDGFDGIKEFTFPVESSAGFNVPKICVLANIVQSIVNNKSLLIKYTSLSSGDSNREIIPHTLVNNGIRWHVRAYDRKTKTFRDFVLTRIEIVEILNAPILKCEQKLDDHQWMRVIPLHLVPHPKNIKFPKAIELDFNMQNGQLKINIRAALAGYYLSMLNVDCTERATLNSYEHQLWLKNTPILYGADNLAIAPGYGK